MKKNSNSFIEIAPSLLFVGVYNFYDLRAAIIALIAASLLALVFTIIVHKKTPWILVSSFIFLAIFGGLTLYSGDPLYIKIKPTVIYSLFGLTLSLDSIFAFGITNKVLSPIANFRDQIVRNTAKHSGIFFLFLAITNEIVWRNFSEQTWVLFKVFGFPCLNMCFFGFYFFRLIRREKIQIS